MPKNAFYLAALLLMISSANISAKVKLTEYPADDPRIEYTGRTLADGNGKVRYDWSGVWFRVRFTGPYLAMKCSDTKSSWFNLWVDKEMGPEADRKFLAGAKDTLIVLAEGLGRGEHEVTIHIIADRLGNGRKSI